MDRKVQKTEDEWRSCLDEEQFRICRLKGTEPAFSGKYYDNKKAGTYRCAACSRPLFSSKDKFDSGTGWPSFTAPMDQDGVDNQPDHSHGMIRTEVLCADCGSHLGHVFEENHAPGGMRYCINSASLDFEDES